MGEEARTGTPALDRARGQRGLGEAIAARAGHAGPNNAVHDVEPLSAIGSRTMARGRGRIPTLRSHLRQGGAACRRTGHSPQCQVSTRPRCAEYGPGSACASACRRVYPRAIAAWPSSRRWRSRTSPRPVATALRSLMRAEAMGAIACHLVAQLLDQHRLRLHFGQQNCGERPQFGRVIRQRSGGIQHG